MNAMRIRRVKYFWLHRLTFQCNFRRTYPMLRVRLRQSLQTKIVVDWQKADVIRLKNCLKGPSIPLRTAPIQITAPY
jgi:hypothetical protein